MPNTTSPGPPAIKFPAINKHTKPFPDISKLVDTTETPMRSILHCYDQIVDFALATVFQGRNRGEITVTHVGEGAFNRVIGIDIDGGLDYDNGTVHTPERYVVRLPFNARHAKKHMDSDVAVLRYVSNRLAYPIPGVVAHSSTKENVLGWPYMIQPHMEGKRLLDLFEDMNRAQQDSAIIALMDLAVEMRKLTSDRIGNLVLNPSGVNLIEDFSVHKQDVLCTEQCLNMCQRRKEAQKCVLTLGGGHWQQESWEIWDKLGAMATRLYKLGFFPNSDGFYLFHDDLHEGNILAKLVDDKTVEITGVLDWDSAAFGPACMSVAGHRFLLGQLNEDEKLRKQFESMAGAEVRRHLTKGAHFARELFRILRGGIYHRATLSDIESIINEFNRTTDTVLREVSYRVCPNAYDGNPAS